MSAASNVAIELPSWIWGGNATEFARVAGLRARNTPRSGVWSVQTVESYSHQPADLVDAAVVVSEDTDQLDRLAMIDRDIDPAPAGHFDPMIDQLLRDRPDDLTALFSAMASRTTTVATSLDDLRERVAMHWRTLRNIRFKENDELAFPHASVSRVRVRQALQMRAAIPRVLSRVGYESALMERPPEVTEPGFTFASGRSLNEGIYLFDVYLAPLMLAATPYVWCIPAYTGKQVILYDLGVPIRGTSGSAVEPLQILSHRGVLHAAPAPTFERDSTVRATEWWSRRLNELFAIVSNPAVFRRSNGEYSATYHLHSLLTVEQLFRHVQGILTHHRDVHARRVLLLSFFDTFGRLVDGDIPSWCNPSKVERTIRRIESSIPTSARKLLMPASHASLFGLQKLSDGFFFGLSPDKARVRLLAVRDRTQELSRNVATGRYLQLLRDATHGFGEKGGQTNSRDESLLTQHTGEIPDQLGLLSYTYLLDLLCDPGRLESKLRRHTYE